MKRRTAGSKCGKGWESGPSGKCVRSKKGLSTSPQSSSPDQSLPPEKRRTNPNKYLGLVAPIGLGAALVGTEIYSHKKEKERQKAEDKAWERRAAEADRQYQAAQDYFRRKYQDWSKSENKYYGTRTAGRSKSATEEDAANDQRYQAGASKFYSPGFARARRRKPLTKEGLSKSLRKKRIQYHEVKGRDPEEKSRFVKKTQKMAHAYDKASMKMGFGRIDSLLLRLDRKSDGKCGKGWKPGAGGKCVRKKMPLHEKIGYGTAAAVLGVAGLTAAGGLYGQGIRKKLKKGERQIEKDQKEVREKFRKLGDTFKENARRNREIDEEINRGSSPDAPSLEDLVKEVGTTPEEFQRWWDKTDPNKKIRKDTGRRLDASRTGGRCGKGWESGPGGKCVRPREQRLRRERNALLVSGAITGGTGLLAAYGVAKGLKRINEDLTKTKSELKTARAEMSAAKEKATERTERDGGSSSFEVPAKVSRTPLSPRGNERSFVNKRLEEKRHRQAMDRLYQDEAAASNSRKRATKGRGGRRKSSNKGEEADAARSARVAQQEERKRILAGRKKKKTVRYVGDSKMDRENLDFIAEEISSSHGIRVDSVHSVQDLDNGVVEGTASSGGNFFDFRIDARSVSVSQRPDLSLAANERARGVLAAKGINYRGDSAYEFLRGLESRMDAPQGGGKCGKGWEPGPGGKCVRSKGGLSKRGLAIGAAGALALGGAAYMNRGAIKQAAGEAKSNIKGAVNRAANSQYGKQARSMAGEAKRNVQGVANRVANSSYGKKAQQVAGQVQSNVQGAVDRVANSSYGKQARSMAGEVKRSAQGVAGKVERKARQAGGEAKRGVQGAAGKVERKARQVGGEAKRSAQGALDRVASSSYGKQARSMASKAKRTVQSTAGKVERKARQVGGEAKRSVEGLGQEAMNQARRVKRRIVS